MLAAMAEVAAERGALDATVSLVVARSGVSRRTFYEIFEGREDCFLAAIEDALERVAEPVLEAYRSERSWRAKMRAALSTLLDFCEREPAAGRLLFVDSLGGGQPVQARRRAIVSGLIAVVEEGRREAPGDGPPQLSAEGIVGATLSVLHARLLEEYSSGELMELVNPLMSIVVLPYLGRAAANKELLRRPAIRRSSAARRTGGTHLLRELGMRLTYRTVCVLDALERWPSGSNRQIGASAGISDQGQISRLLARLEGLGLVKNVGADAEPGGPNAWVLTDTGQELQSTIKQQVLGA